MVKKLRILHPCIDVTTIRYVQEILNNDCNRIQAKQSMQRHNICLAHSDYDYILDYIECREIFILKGMELVILTRNIIDVNIKSALSNVGVFNKSIKYICK